MLVSFGFVSACRRHRFAEGVITNVPTSVGSDWVNIPMANPLIAKWDSVIIFVNVNSTFQISHDPLGIRLDDGSIAAPVAELITKTGQRHSLRLSGLTSGEVDFGSDDIAPGSSFSDLRIWSPKALRCYQITWVSYMARDCGSQGCKFLRLVLDPTTTP